MSIATHDDTAAAALQILRQPFPPDNIAKLPKVNCWDCTQAGKDRKGSTCTEHRKAKCKDCGAYISTGHIHLDYVGHAETTDRLLEADLAWNWEPLAFTESGLPQLDRFDGLWIRLTVGGVTRLGYGSADGKPGPNGVKEAIGDAIRNAAMRFGVALNLWAKTELHADEDETPPAAQDAAKALPQSHWESPAVPAAASVGVQTAQLQKIGMYYGQLDVTDRDDRLAKTAVILGLDAPPNSTKDLTQAQAEYLIKFLKGKIEERRRGAEGTSSQASVPGDSFTAIENVRNESFAAIEEMIGLATGRGQLNEAYAAIGEEVRAGRITDADADVLAAHLDARNAELQGASA